MKLVVATAIAASIVIGGVSTADAEVELKNDSFVDGSMVAVQGGFAPGEIAAARFNVASPRQLLKVRLIFATELSGGQARDVTLHVWADSQSGNNPGQELYSGAAVAAFANGAVDEIACDSPRQTAEQRLAVYAHAYWARLLECLREEFPVLRITVGEEAFDGLAVGYLMAHPSTSYTLGRLSERFAAYLQSTTAGDEADAFSALVIDLTRLEQSVNDVFDAPGGETLGFLTTEQLDQVLLEQRGALRLLLLTTVRLLSFRTNANEVFTATRAGAATLPMPELRPTFAALTRRDYVVRRLSLTPTQFELLTTIASGQSLLYSKICKHIFKNSIFVIVKFSG